MSKFASAIVTLICLLASCSESAPPGGAAATAPASRPGYTEPPPLDPNNIVSIASASADHTTLVAALQAADYVRSVANPGPLTVFAPTNAAFARLPAGTLDALLQPDKVGDLKEILKYHVAVSVYEQKALKDGMSLGMANLKDVEFQVVDGKVKVNGANILASIRASNGIIHVIDGVLLPPQ